MPDKCKVALVTGVNSGIGKASASAFARRGYSLIVIDRDIELGRETEQQLRAFSPCVFLDCNLAEEAAVEAKIREGMKHYGERLDVAFNAISIEGDSMMTKATTENWCRIMTETLKSISFCMKYEIQQMLTQGEGTIVNCAPTAGFDGLQDLSAYNASTHEIILLTRTAALEYARNNIRINAVCPSIFAEALRWQGSMSSETTKLLLENAPNCQLSIADQVAVVVLWLCDSMASLVNGQAVAVDRRLIPA